MFASDRAGGTFNVYQKPSNGAGNDELVFKSSGGKKPYSWSVDGRYLVWRGVEEMKIQHSVRTP